MSNNTGANLGFEDKLWMAADILISAAENLGKDFDRNGGGNGKS